MALKELLERFKPRGKETPTIPEILEPIETETLLIDALTLWREVAPQRPYPDGKSAVFFSFNFKRPKHPQPISDEVKVFNRLLRPYWRTQQDVFTAVLFINPEWLEFLEGGQHLPHPEQLGAGPVSFHLKVFAPEHPQFPDLSCFQILDIFEVPGLEFERRAQTYVRPHDIRIATEGPARYTNELKWEVVGFANEGKGILLNPSTTTPQGDMPWKKGFLREVLNNFATMCQEIPENKRKELDQRLQKRGIAVVRKSSGLFRLVYPETT